MYQNAPNARSGNSLSKVMKRTGRTLRWFRESLGLDFESVRSNPSKRPLVRSCLDWTEQRPHIAGLLGTELLHTFHRNGWITKDQSDRSLRITRIGQGALATLNMPVEAVCARHSDRSENSLPA
jgi:hypothetical protein